MWKLAVHQRLLKKNNQKIRAFKQLGAQNKAKGRRGNVLYCNKHKSSSQAHHLSSFSVHVNDGYFPSPFEFIDKDSHALVKRIVLDNNMFLLFIIYIFVLLRIVLDNKHNRNLFT